MTDTIPAPSTIEQTESPLAFKEDLGAFRLALRSWIERTVPKDWRERHCGGTAEEFARFQRWWFDQLRAARLANSHWPVEWGGEGLSLAHRIVIFEEMARAQAPSAEMFVISLYHLPATLFAHGTAAQRERFLNGVVEQGEVWAQGFSEPNAGSDLASLRTRAERKTIDGRDVYVVNGQKTWSSFGMFADWYLLLARTDLTARKQAGISYFIMDMRAPGVTVRPIRQITGESEFAEVFLDNVEIPAENLIGKENEGWSIAQSTLAAERGLIIFEAVERMAIAFEREVEMGRGTWMKDTAYLREFSALYVKMKSIRLLVRRMLKEVERDPHMGGSETATYIKLGFAVLLQAYNEFMLRVSGFDAQFEKPAIRSAGHHTANRFVDYLSSYSWTISGGSNEIMRNVVAERILGLPRG
ncbi:acyl-CoA dehydrogenase [Novosphingobium colocasiae]|uniref:Acyl-CoA dehydrogenase n=2 Tax=Novosphingobium colocasiae TaxID=1256513 RepID=A0A918PIS3_9SPHN|nr:acyl-CoA dehydrogenase [Novosphingobium colocasiae]